MIICLSAISQVESQIVQLHENGGEKHIRISSDIINTLCQGREPFWILLLCQQGKGIITTLNKFRKILRCFQACFSELDRFFKELFCQSKIALQKTYRS